MGVQDWEVRQMRTNIDNLVRTVSMLTDRLQSLSTDYLQDVSEMRSRIADMESTIEAQHADLAKFRLFVEWMQDVHPGVIVAYEASTAVIKRME